MLFGSFVSTSKAAIGVPDTIIGIEILTPSLSFGSSFENLLLTFDGSDEKNISTSLMDFEVSDSGSILELNQGPILIIFGS